jgi:hypothetical protein
MPLTVEQKHAIIRYITGWSAKPILEDVDEVGTAWTEENGDQLYDEVWDFLNECGTALERWFEDEHCKHLDRQGPA